MPSLRPRPRVPAPRLPVPGGALIAALIAAVALLGLLSCFLWLERAPMFETDEARYAVNAWEMLHTREWFNYTFGGEPDRWNAKPQLLVWLQALGYSVLGARELAVRLPSAAAALATGAVGWFLFRRRFGFSPALAALGVTALYTMRGIVGFHTGRTGDMDALFTLFTTATAYFLLGKGTRSAVAAGLAFGLAFLAKGFAVLLMAPGLLLLPLVTLGFRGTLGDVRVRIAACAAAVIPIGWMAASAAFGRNYGDQAFEGKDQLATMFLYDVLARFRGTMDAVPPPPNPTFLITQLDVMMSPWGFLLVALVAFHLARPFSRPRFLADPAVRAGAALVVPAAAIIQLSSHKLPWYVSPLLPFAILVLLAGVRHAMREGGRVAKATAIACALLVPVAVVRQALSLAKVRDDGSRRVLLANAGALGGARELRYETRIRQDEMVYLSWARGGVVSGIPQGDGIELADRPLAVACGGGVCVFSDARAPVIRLRPNPRKPKPRGPLPDE